MQGLLRLPVFFTLVISLSLMGLSEPAFAKKKNNKKADVVAPAPAVTSESRLAEWQQTPQAARGNPANVCERDYKELRVVYDYFNELSRRLKPISVEKRNEIEAAQQRILAPHPGTTPGSDQDKAERERIYNEQLSGDPDWYQYQLDMALSKALKDMGPYAVESAWKQQEIILHDYLDHLRGKTYYPVAAQSQPFISIKALMEIKTDIANVFERLDESKSEFDRLLEFDRIHLLGLDDTPSYLILKNSFLSGSADPVIACHLDYLSSF